MDQQLQKRLDEYRLRKRRREYFEQLKSKLKRFWMLGTGAQTDGKNNETTIDITKEQSPEGNETADVDEDLVLSTDEEENLTVVQEEPESNRLFKYTLYAVYTLFWITLYIIAIQLQFGIVFLMFSALFGIYFNTRTRPRKRNEISAYSVFNKNCESIDGTLKAEQFEREIRFGSASVK